MCVRVCIPVSVCVCVWGGGSGGVFTDREQRESLTELVSRVGSCYDVMKLLHGLLNSLCEVHLYISM